MKTKEKKLKIDDAYDVLVDYLKKYYKKIGSRDIASLIDEMSLLEDDSSADPAAQEDWYDSVNKILHQCDQSSKLHNNLLTRYETYKAAIDFLDGYCSRTGSDEVQILRDKMQSLSNGTSINSNAWADWINSVDKILSQKPRIRPRFGLIKPDKNE